MVLDYYNLKEQPFGVTPDPRYLYLSPTHREALASLSYGIRTGRGFMSIIAQPGMGKTTVLFELLKQLEGSARTAFLFQTLCGPKDLLRSLLRDLGIEDNGRDAVTMQEQLKDVLVAEARQGRRVVVIIDEAQNLEDSALELVRMLSNFETTSDKLMQIVLAGQPQLRDKLASPQLLQLRQRMSIFARLHPLSADETHLYLDHRLRVAGYDFKTPLFSPRAEALIAKYSQGIPRNINNICFNALSLGCVMSQESIREEVVREVLDDLELKVEDAHDLEEEEPAGRRLFALRVTKPATASLRSFGWRRRVVFCTLLLLPLLWIGHRQSPKNLNFRSGSAVTAPSRVAAMFAYEVSPGHGDSVSSVVGGERQPAEKSMPKASAGEMSGRAESVSSPSAQESRPPARQGLERTSDPTNLWAQVKKQNSDAEVELARLYLEGTSVPQNCAQAEVLLLAAARKGNTHAADLLNDSGGRCR